MPKKVKETSEREVWKTKGRRLLAEAIAARGLSATQAAISMGVSPAQFTGWLRGDFGPSLRYGVQIAKLFDVPIESWAEDIDEDANEDLDGQKCRETRVGSRSTPRT